jgi:hypothetical protein
MTKLLVGLGFSMSGLTNNIEIIDLESELTTCQNLTNFPLELRGSFGGLGFQDKPMICGGYNSSAKYSDKCFSLEGNEWINSSSFITVLYQAAVSPSPYPSSDQKLFVTYEDAVEVLTLEGWETLPQRLPVETYGHCSVLFNSTTVLVIGGYQNRSLSSNTFLFNTENEIWAEGPQLKKERMDHSCGRIRKNSHSQDFSIIVVGGVEGLGWKSTPGHYFSFSSVEILDLGANEWRKGPDLPFGIDLAQMVEDPNGGVVLVGGRSDFYRYLDTLYQLPHGGADAVWTKMEQKLKIARRDHVAFLVPDDVVDCT